MLNILDLGFFRTLQMAYWKLKGANNTDGLIAKVLKAWKDYDPVGLWLTHQAVCNKIFEQKGGNDYIMPHIGKESLARTGELPRQLRVPTDKLISDKKRTCRHPFSHLKCPPKILHYGIEKNSRTLFIERRRYALQSTIQILGVYFDQHLTMRRHVAKLMNQSCFQSDLQSMYIAFICSGLEYAVPVQYFLLFKTQLKKLAAIECKCLGFF